jgi:2-oxoacid:acceptor oxidoreductase delta subunit (pyruvate/2-ketoisovalerate family)
MTEKKELRIRKPPAELLQSQQPIVLETLEDYPYKSVALGSTRSNLTGLWRYWRPFYQTKRAPCDASCPVGNQVVDYIQTMLEGHWPEAARFLRSENPLPAITGRVCHRPCEISCNRRQYDKRIAIHDIEAVLAEVKHEMPCFPSIEQPRDVAVVGSGPAELAFAHFMALLHHRVTLFEAADALGGRLRYGPQARHLPDGLLDSEIERIVAGRIEIRRGAPLVEDLEADYDAILGVLGIPEHLTLRLSSREAESRSDARFLDRLLGDEAQQVSAIQIPLRVSEAIGYGKWAALLLDADWRGLNPSATLTQIQVGGNARIVSALKYLALLTNHRIERSEEVVTYEKLQLDMLDPAPPPEPSEATQQFAATRFVSPDDIEHALLEAARCLSCGRCNQCDNCWIYCPDAVISRVKGEYEIDYDYCKGCTLCAAVCPRGVISIIEEEKWSG